MSDCRHTLVMVYYLIGFLGLVMLINPNKIRFILSAGTLRELPPSPGKEYALLGRSNVGKSSFINHVCSNQSLARTSKHPGTTVCANLYGIAENLFWVDLPGYGFARTARNEKARWSHLIRDYCEKRRNLAGIIWLVDSRHIGVAMDREAYAWLVSLKKPVMPVLTKSDKLTNRERIEQQKSFVKEFGSVGTPILYSLHEQACREMFWQRYEKWAGI
jgi:GTP-binding protein